MTTGSVRRSTLITLLRTAAQQMVDELVARLNAAGYPGIRPAHSQVMENIDPDGTRITDLANRARISHPSMIDLVVGLERLSYLERVPDPTDARARLVRLTPTGRSLQRRAVAEIVKIEKAWLAELGVTAGPQLHDALARLIGSRTP